MTCSPLVNGTEHKKLYLGLSNLSFLLTQPKIVSRIFLKEAKSISFPFIRSFRQSNRNSKGSGKENRNSGGEEWLMILEFGGHGGGRAYWNFQRLGGLKCPCHPW